MEATSEGHSHVTCCHLRQGQAMMSRDAFHSMTRVTATESGQSEAGLLLSILPYEGHPLVHTVRSVQAEELWW